MFRLVDEGSYDGLFALLGGALIFFALAALAVLVFHIIVSIKLYQKAGRQGWEAIVPYYSTWVYCEIAGVKWWMMLVMCATSICGILGLVFLEPLASLVGLFGTFIANYNVALKFGKDPIGYGIGLTLLPTVFYAILALGNSTFNDVAVSAYGPFKEEQVESTFGKKAESTTSQEAPKESSKETSKKTSKTKANFCKNCGAEIKDAKFCPNCGTEIH